MPAEVALTSLKESFLRVVQSRLTPSGGGSGHPSDRGSRVRAPVYGPMLFISETRIQGRHSKSGGVCGWAADDRRTESGKQAGRRKKVYSIRRHSPAGGSDLLEGDCFLVSPRQGSNTLVVEW